MVCPEVREVVGLGGPSPKSQMNTVFGEVFVLLLMNSTAWGAHTWVRPPTGMRIEALVLFSITTVPVMTHPEDSSVKVTVYCATAAVQTWFTLWGGTNDAPNCVGEPSPQLTLYAPRFEGEATSSMKFVPLQLYHIGASLGLP